MCFIPLCTTKQCLSESKFRSMSENRIKSPKSNRKNSASTPKVKTKVVQQNNNGLQSTVNRPLRLRIVLVGNEQIGKSCLIKRYCEKRFVSKYLPTIGIDYGATKIFVDKREVGIHIFDTSGKAHTVNP